MKKTLKILTIGLSSLTVIATIPSVATINNSLTQSNLSYDISNPKTKAIQDGQEATAGFKFVEQDVAEKNEWWGKQRVDNVTNEQIKSLLIPYDTKSGGNLVGVVDYNVQILPISNDDRRNGGVRFTITQIAKKYLNGALDPNTPIVEVKINKPGATGTTNADYTWSTYEDYSSIPITSSAWGTFGGNFKGLAIIEKYNFAWNDDDIIGAYIKKTFDDRLEANSTNITPDAIFSNFIKQDDNHIVPNDYSITIRNNGPSSTSGESFTNWDKYGLLEVSIKFYNTNKTDWIGDKFPSGAIEGTEPTDLKTPWIEIKKVFRGFYSNNGEIQNTNVFLDNGNIDNIKNATIMKTGTNNPFTKYLLNNENKLSDLMPSELKELSLNGNSLLNFLYNNEWREPSVSDSLIKLSYFGKDVRKFSDNTTDNKILPKDYRKDSDIKSIDVTPNDKDGSAIFTYHYDYYDVYSGKTIKDAVLSQTFPAGSFKVNPDAGKQLILSAKAANEVNAFTSSKDLMDLYEANKTNDTYLKSLSNLFVNGTNDALSKDRQVQFEYVNDNGHRATGPTQNVKMILTFDSWNGESYMSSGNKVDGKQIIQTFEFPSIDSLVSVNWKDNTTVANDINAIIKTSPNDQSKTIADFSPSEIVDLLYTNDSLNTAFTNGVPANATLSYFSDNSTGSLIVKAQSNTTAVKKRSATTFLNDASAKAVNSGYIQTRIFTGFKATNEQFQEFGWIDNSEVDVTLLQKELESITVDDVIHQYLKKIDFFKDMNLTNQNVQIVKNSDTGTLTVYVTINEFNQDIPMANNKFSTVLRGFPVGSIEDRNSYKAPVDLTVILSAILGGLVVLGLGGYLGKTIFNRVKTNKIKNKF